MLVKQLNKKRAIYSRDIDSIQKDEKASLLIEENRIIVIAFFICLQNFYCESHFFKNRYVCLPQLKKKALIKELQKSALKKNSLFVNQLIIYLQITQSLYCKPLHFLIRN